MLWCFHRNTMMLHQIWCVFVFSINLLNFVLLQEPNKPQHFRFVQCSFEFITHSINNCSRVSLLYAISVGNAPSNIAHLIVLGLVLLISYAMNSNQLSAELSNDSSLYYTTWDKIGNLDFTKNQGTLISLFNSLESDIIRISGEIFCDHYYLFWQNLDLIHTLNPITTIYVKFHQYSTRCCLLRLQSAVSCQSNCRTPVVFISCYFTTLKFLAKLTIPLNFTPNLFIICSRKI